MINPAFYSLPQIQQLAEKQSMMQGGMPSELSYKNMTDNEFLSLPGTSISDRPVNMNDTRGAELWGRLSGGQTPTQPAPAGSGNMSPIPAFLGQYGPQAGPAPTNPFAMDPAMQQSLPSNPQVNAELLRRVAERQKLLNARRLGGRI